jgi:hypothetical protein
MEYVARRGIYGVVVLSMMIRMMISQLNVGDRWSPPPQSTYQNLKNVDLAIT